MMTEANPGAPASPPHPAPSEAGPITLGTLLCNCGLGPYNVMPSFLAAVATSYHVSDAQIGILSGVENAGIAAAGLLASLFIRRINAPLLFVACLVSLLGNTLVGMATTFHQLVVERSLTAMFGEGPIYAASFIALGRTARPARAYGISMTASALLTAAAVEGSGALNRMFGAVGVLVPFAACAVLVMPTLRWLPVTAAPDHARPEIRRGGGQSLRSLVMLAAIAVWGAGPGAFWTFAEVIALARHVPASTIESALSVGLLAGLFGSLVPVVMPAASGRNVPLALATIGLALSILLFMQTATFLWLAAALSLVQAFWNAGTVLQFAALSAADFSGRAGPLAVVAQLGGYALGPIMAGAAMSRFGDNMIIIGTSLAMLAGLAMSAAMDRPARLAKAPYPGASLAISQRRPH